MRVFCGIKRPSQTAGPVNAERTSRHRRHRRLEMKKSPASTVTCLRGINDPRGSTSMFAVSRLAFRHELEVVEDDSVAFGVLIRGLAVNDGLVPAHSPQVDVQLLRVVTRDAMRCNGV